MKRIFTLFFISIVSLLSFLPDTFAQTPDTTRPSIPSPPANAGFDVIIKKNGDLVYGLVKEVNLEFIIYQRTDIPDGPFYTIPRVEVYAISYRNQVKDILAPINNPGAPLLDPRLLPDYNDYNYRLTRDRLFRNGMVRVGLGFLRSYSKVKDADQYSTSASFPTVSIGYDVRYNRTLRVGIMAAIGSHKFNTDKLSLYDSTQSNVQLKESIFNIYLYGRYDLLSGSRSALRPYLTFGVGLNTAHITSESTVSFLNNSDQQLLIKSGTRAAGIGFMGRAGADYYFNNQVSAFADVGFGASVLNIGVSFKVN
jgi:outer membrane protein W